MESLARLFRIRGQLKGSRGLQVEAAWAPAKQHSLQHPLAGDKIRKNKRASTHHLYSLISVDKLIYIYIYNVYIYIYIQYIYNIVYIYIYRCVFLYHVSRYPHDCWWNLHCPKYRHRRQRAHFLFSSKGMEIIFLKSSSSPGCFSLSNPWRRWLWDWFFFRKNRWFFNGKYKV